jgi:hypothetical protein
MLVEPLGQIVAGNVAVTVTPGEAARFTLELKLHPFRSVIVIL